MQSLEPEAPDTPLPLSPKAQLAKQVVASLRGLGIDAAWLPASAPDGIDGHLRISWADGTRLFPAEVKATARPALVALWGRQPSGTILMTEHVTATLADALEQSGWAGYADATGNASLQAGGLLIRITGRPPRRTVRPSTTLPFTGTGLPVTFALLVADARGAVWTQRDLARLTGSSLGTVNRVLQSLRAAGHLAPDGRLSRPRQLSDQWTAAYLAAQPEEWPDERYSSSRWAAARDVLEADLPEGALVGSELAAYRYGTPIRPTTALIHCPPECRQELITRGRLRRDPQGTITVRPAFWTTELVHGVTTAPPFLVRADLLLENDPRLSAVARGEELTWNDWT